MGGVKFRNVFMVLKVYMKKYYNASIQNVINETHLTIRFDEL